MNKNRLKTLLHACFCRDKKAAKDYTKKKVGKEIRVLRNWSGLYRMIRSWHRMIRSWLILNPFSRILQKLFQSIVTFTLTRLLAPLLLVMRDRCNRRTIQTIRERSHQKLSRLLGQPSQKPHIKHICNEYNGPTYLLEFVMIRMFRLRLRKLDQILNWLRHWFKGLEVQPI